MARSGRDIARDLIVFGSSLSQKGLSDYAGRASNEGAGRGRQAGTTGLPEPARIYASALLDKNTCPACYGIDGKQYATLEESLADFPVAGYIDCDGGDRCRCTRVFVWPTEADPTLPRPGDRVPASSPARPAERRIPLPSELPPPVLPPLDEPDG